MYYGRAIFLSIEITMTEQASLIGYQSRMIGDIKKRYHDQHISQTRVNVGREI